MASSGAGDHSLNVDLNRELAETEMVRAAVVEFLRMERSLHAAAAHLAAAEDIRAAAGGETGNSPAADAPELSALATRLALPG